MAGPVARSGFVMERDGVLTPLRLHALQVNSLSIRVGPRGDTSQTDAAAAQGDKVAAPPGSIRFIGHR